MSAEAEKLVNLIKETKVIETSIVSFDRSIRVMGVSGLVSLQKLQDSKNDLIHVRRQLEIELGKLLVAEATQ